MPNGEIPGIGMVKVEPVLDMFKTVDNYFQVPPQGADALVPVNPSKYPAHYVATAITSDMQVDGNPWIKPIENVQITLDYLETCIVDDQYNQRFACVVHDMCIIEGLHNLPCGIGIPLAGDYANEMCNQYENEIANKLLDPDGLHIHIICKKSRTIFILFRK